MIQLARASVVFSMMFAMGSAAIAASEPIWQTDNHVKVHLGIRSKFGASKYVVQYVLTSGHKKYTAKKNVNANDWAGVTFPDDFPDAGQDGEYHWQVLVGGKPVSSGSFAYTKVGKPDSSGFSDTQVRLHEDARLGK